ncbi:MAG TPA: hypothetical protein VHV47_14250 [Opitutaceae bacterium]|jgi:hypothetical protein|nr:hypothetical protein [Opitutaceae bacterium]
MPRLRLSALLLAWLCASGAALDLAQVFAWGRMFAGYARHESLAAAASETFDPAKPCDLCRAVTKAREQSKESQPAIPAAGAERLWLVCERPAPVILNPSRPVWTEIRREAPVPWSLTVPVPPPRAAAV